VNGVNNLIYSLAREQVALGHEVTLLLYGSPDESALRFAAETGVRFSQAPTPWSDRITFASTLDASVPDIVHMHSVFIPQQWILGKILSKQSIPFVITPHGGLSPFVLARSPWKKAIYSWLIERPRFSGAAGITVVTPDEEAEVRSFLPRFHGPIAWISNIFDTGPLEQLSWSPQDAETIVFLGRFDIVGKGIDILLDIARQLGDFRFHLYGAEDRRSDKTTLAQLKQRCGSNVHFHEPVFGSAKAAVLSRASLYLQMSRWEAFGLSVAEAMYLGLPCAIASTMHLASVFEDHDLGLVVVPNPKTTGELIRNALSNPAQLRAWSRNARNFARSNFHPRTVASRFVAFYEDCIKARRSNR
jgi:glycosyltransferase involved in cell wall biosynthesis